MNQLRRYAVGRLGRDGWGEVAADAGLPADGYQVTAFYPDEDLVKLVLAASKRAGAPVSALLEEFGVFLAPALLRVYEPLVDPAWRTLEVIEHTEEAIHTVVRARMEGAAPPALVS
ncbi:MAG TPA: heme NO-binding domain-containing protein, partial [Longimicrobiaceae bacterium]|nr:heme NO-binding domain-containing protein [Longimicrobiaceae bacterium]